jgi:hypothetical protein
LNCLFPSGFPLNPVWTSLLNIKAAWTSHSVLFHFETRIILVRFGNCEVQHLICYCTELLMEKWNCLKVHPFWNTLCPQFLSKVWITMNYICVCVCFCLWENVTSMCCCLWVQEQLTRQNLTSQTNSRRLSEAEAAKSNLTKHLDECKTELQQSNSVENVLKEQLESKEEVLRSDNKEQKELTSTINGLTKPVGR